MNGSVHAHTRATVRWLSPHVHTGGGRRRPNQRRSTYGYSLYYRRLQHRSHTVTASITYGYNLYCTRLQHLSQTATEDGPVEGGRPAGLKAVKPATLEAARSSTRGRGRDPRGRDQRAHPGSTLAILGAPSCPGTARRDLRKRHDLRRRGSQAEPLPGGSAL